MNSSILVEPVGAFFNVPRVQVVELEDTEPEPAPLTDQVVRSRIEQMRALIAMWQEQKHDPASR